MEKLELIEKQNTILTLYTRTNGLNKKKSFDRIELKNNRKKKEDNCKVFTTLFTTKEKTLSNLLKDRVLTFLFVVPPGIYLHVKRLCKHKCELKVLRLKKCIGSKRGSNV